MDFHSFPKKQGLYDPALEKDSCGVGLVAHLKKQASRKTVEDANEMLVRMAHRGACGCEVNTGDGAGVRMKCSAYVAQKRCMHA
jgi:glutamate synthase domain-containing protein 1